MPDQDRLDHLADQLDVIEEDLRDRAYERLAAAAADPGSDEAREAAATERRLNQARRAVAKASSILRGRPTEDH